MNDTRTCCCNGTTVQHDAILVAQSSLPPSPLSLQEVALYCVACAGAVCEDCVTGDHAGHPTEPLTAAVEKLRLTLQERVAAATNR